MCSRCRDYEIFMLILARCVELELRFTLLREFSFISSRISFHPYASKIHEEMEKIDGNLNRNDFNESTLHLFHLPSAHPHTQAAASQRRINTRWES